jgi:urease accessory protein
MRRAIAVHTRGHWPEEAAVDSVTLAMIDRHRRRIRLVADSGAHPEIIAVVEFEPVIDIAAETPADLLRIAWHLGNRHLPLQVHEGGLRVRADHVIASMVEGLGGRVTRMQAPFDPEIGAYGGAAHSHPNDDDR